MLTTTLLLETNPEEVPGEAGDVRPGPEEEVGVLAARPMSTRAAPMALPRVVTGITMQTTIGTRIKGSILGTSVRDGTTPGIRNVLTS